MKKPFLLISITTAILILITAGSVFGFSWMVILWLVLTGHVMLIISVISVLRTPAQSKKTFETDFYEDFRGREN